MGEQKQITQHAQEIVDAALATGAITTPLWLQTLEEGIHIYILIGGAVLLTLRVVKLVREMRSKRNADTLGTDNDAGVKPNVRRDDTVGKEDGSGEAKD